MRYNEGDKAYLTPAEAAKVSEYLMSTSDNQWLLVDQDEGTLNDLAEYSDQLSDLDQTMVATVPEGLCLERFPGQGMSGICTPEETIPHGGAAPQLIAHAFLHAAMAADIAINNGG